MPKALALCERCGSIQIVRARSRLADRVIALLTVRRPFVCRRCGWRGRRAWTDSDLAKTADLSFSGEAEVDPSLVALDDIPREAVRPSEFELSTLDLTQPVTADPKNDSTRHRRRGKRRRQKRSRRREIFAAIALLALAIFGITLLGVTGSCVASGAPFKGPSPTRR